jgi:prepilin-type N-terminal cleavage/methylation domain-containing protein
MKTRYPKRGGPQSVKAGKAGESGFTLIETSIALVILMIAMLGAASLFIYASNYNSGANERALALAVAQQQMERLRKTPAAQIETPAQPEPDIVLDGKSYGIVTTVSGTSSLKKITLQVTPRGGQGNWMRGSVVIVAERSQTGTGTYYP